MAEEETRDPRALSISPDGFLAAPTGSPVNGTRGRSASAAPSYRSTQSHITTVEEKEDLPGFDVSDLKTKYLQRQQTYKFGRNLSLMDRLRGVLFPRWLMTQMENSIEVIPSEVSDDEMFHRTKSPWIVDVYVSPKHDSTNFHQTRCLLDTGCSHGNIVSKDLVKQLGYTEADYQELSDLESREAITLAGQPFPVEAAILLSWHHNTSLKRFRQMRFLVSSQAKNYDMVIGAQTICKYSLLSRPVFSLDQGVANYSSPDPTRNHLIIDRSTLLSRVEDIGRKKEKADSKEKKGLLENEQLEVQHLLDLKCIEVDLRGAKDEAEKQTLQAKLEQTTKAWDLKHPKNTTDLVAKRFWAQRKKASASQAPPDKKGATSSVDHGAQAKKSSTNGGRRPRKI